MNLDHLIIEKVARPLLNRCVDAIPENHLPIFLCGAEKSPLRDEIRTIIENKHSKYYYHACYPEKVYEFFFNEKDNSDIDFLTLENNLANYAACIAILVHSPGTYTELGAFSNHEPLKDKIIAIQDVKYKNVPSFISRGPIKYLKSNKCKSTVFYEDISSIHKADIIADKIMNFALKSHKRNSEKEPFASELSKLASPFINELFVYALIYLLGPIEKGKIYDFCKNLENDTNKSIFRPIVACSIYSLLENKKLIFKDETGFLLSNPEFSEPLLKFPIKNISKFQNIMYNLRLVTLNLRFRKRYYKKCCVAI